MKPNLWSPNEALEDLLLDQGLPVRCLVAETSGEADQVQIVFPQERELDLANALEKLGSTQKSAFERMFPSGAKFVFRTILYHLSRDLLSAIPEQGGPFVSTNIRNLWSPSRREIKGVPGAYALYYDVDLVLVYQDAPDYSRATAEERASELISRFNGVSRYLRIANLTVAHTPHRALLPGERRPEPHPVALRVA